MTAGLPLMKNVLTPFAKSILIPLGLLSGMSATDVAIPKKENPGSDITSLLNSN